ncbi:hypothetical protein GQR58_015989 [Nymphon striatum]|nr:hypothetical protein GQR58_015989 [Nymphon striatum]
MVYGEAQGSSNRAVQIYSERFPGRRLPNLRTFSTTHRRVRETGSLKVRRPDSGIVRDADVDEEIFNYFDENPNSSSSAAANVLGLSHSLVCRVLKSNSLHPFRFHRVQGLVMVMVMVLGEGVFNSHNNHEWRIANPHNTRSRSFQSRFSIIVWAGIIGDYLIGPHILADRMNGDAYAQFLQNVLPGLLVGVPVRILRRMWFQQDGAPIHYARAATNILNDRYPNRWIGRGGPVA